MKTRMTALPIMIGALLCLPATVMAQDVAPAAALPEEVSQDTNAVANNNADAAANADDQKADKADNNDSAKDDPKAQRIAYYASQEERDALVKARMAKAEEEEEKAADEAAVASADEAAKSADDAAKAADDAKDGEEEDDKPWSVMGKISFDLGLGAFTKHKYAKRIRSRMVVELAGSYTIPVIDTDVSLSTGFSQWLSEGGDSNGKHAFRWADSSIDFSRAIWSTKTTVGNDTPLAFSISGDLGFTLPTSQASIASNLYTQIIPSIALAFKVGGFSAGYTISYAHSFHEFTSQTMDPDEVDILSRTNGVELIGAADIAVDGVLTEIELSNLITLGYAFLDNLSLTLGLGFVDAWTYDNGTITKKDELTNELAHVGRGHQQISQGILALSYQPASWVSLGLSMVSTQPWKTADNKTIRFPWFDTVSPSKNFTKFMVSATFQY